MADEISRRNMLGFSAGAAATAFTGSNWVFTLAEGDAIVKAATNEDSTVWKPVLLSKIEAEQVAIVSEAIIPKTDTVGARGARVHEYIDLALSVEGKKSQRSFREGLKALNRNCKAVTGEGLEKVSESDLIAVLESVSDTHDSHPAELKQSAAFFKDIKRRTIFGYYTSKEGRVQELGKRAAVSMESYQGCTHGQDAH